MTKIYCHTHHRTKKGLCSDCNSLFEYSKLRTEKCVFGEEKPECGDCPVHCYKKEMREKVREIMRFAGPRMAYKHPVLAFIHLWRKLMVKKKEKFSVKKNTNKI
jgi:hypothetical protein